MADKKISALPAATTPLAGTEVLPIVQGGTTDQVSVANLTVGRDIGTKAITTTGNVGVKCTPLSITPLQVSLGTDRRLSTFLNGSDNVLGFLTDAGNWTSTFFTGTPAIFGNGASEAFRIDTNQNIVIKTAAKGIDFSANTNAPGMTSELLTWYEEGTWTPTDGSGAGLSFSNVTNNCFYTRIGRMVVCVFGLSYPSTASVSSAALVGLPFTSRSSATNVAGGYTTYTDAGIQIQLLVGNNDTSVTLWKNTGGAVTNVELSGKWLRGVITYFV
jgi:hypothetical protein